MDVNAIVTKLFTSGLGVDIALSFIVLEFAVLMWRSQVGMRKTTAVNVALALGPGACLMLALRCALTDTEVIWVAFWLAMSLPLHITDIVRRRL